MAAPLLEYTCEEVLGVICFLCAKGKDAANIHRELVSVYGENVMTVQQVRKWCREFHSGRASISDGKQEWASQNRGEGMADAAGG